jgi:predicted ribosome quality control (RQC) complex YloA/Tae2 family protein
MTASPQPDRAENPARKVKPPFDSMTLRVVVAELRQALVGGQIQDVRQPSREEVVLGIRSHGRNLLLALSADARYARVHLTGTRPANAPTPPNFCMTLRKHLENGRIREVRQRDFDRVFELEVAFPPNRDRGSRDNPEADSPGRENGAHGGDEEAPPPVTLIAELMGKHSNLILVNSEGKILDAAKRISHRINRVRETLPGLAYQPPPEQPDRIDPFLPGAVEKIVRELPLLALTEPRPLADAIMQIFAGFSPFLANEVARRALAEPAGPAQGLRAAWVALFGAAQAGRYMPIELRAEGGAPYGAYPFPLTQVVAALQHPVPELNAALDESFRAVIVQSRFEAAFDDLRGRIERELKWLGRQREAVRRALEEAERAEIHKQSGELILANLWQIAPGAAQVQVQDYYEPELPMRTIELDPRRTPQENAELCFSRYRKARGSRDKEMERGAQVEADLTRLTAARAELEQLGTVEAILSLRDELIKRKLLRPSEEHAEGGRANAGPDFQGHKIRRFTTPEGYEIYVGETATANDFLTTRIASPNDVWVHVRAAASSHVVIRTHGRPDQVPRSVIQRAAQLCAQHSAQKHSSLVSVDFTLKKFVRKPRGSAPGAADYEKETTIEVTPEA